MHAVLRNKQVNRFIHGTMRHFLYHLFLQERHHDQWSGVRRCAFAQKAIVIATSVPEPISMAIGRQPRDQYDLRLYGQSA